MENLEKESGLGLRLEGELRPLVLLAMLRDVSFEGLVEEVPAGLPRFNNLDRTIAPTRSLRQPIQRSLYRQLRQHAGQLQFPLD